MASQVQFAGQEITAAFLNSIAPLQAVRSSTQSKTNSTLANDDTLFLALAANATYLVAGKLFYSGDTSGSGDLKIAWTLPSGATGRYDYIHTNLSHAYASFPDDWTGTLTAETQGAGTIVTGTIEGTLTTSSAGTLRLRWAENTTNATATIMAVSSSLCAWRLS